MKRISIAIIATMLLLNGSVKAEVIKPVDVRATSQFGVGANIENLINGDQGPAVGLDPNGPPVFGLTHFGMVAAGGPGILDDEHAVSVGGATSVAAWGWIHGCADGGIAGGSPAEGGTDCSVFGDPGALSTEPIDDQIIEFEFDGAYDLSELHIWNSNDSGTGPDRALDEFEIEVSPDRTGDTFTAVGTTYNATVDLFTGSFSVPVQNIPLVASGVRRVRLLLNSRHGVSADPYVGLSEVRFSGTLVALDAAADGDKDGYVGGMDFLLWQANRGLGEIDNFEVNGSLTFNSTLTATQSEGDYDNNNVINFDDYDAWVAGFGTSSPLPLSGLSIVSTPEPTSLILFGTAALGGLLTRRRLVR